MILTLKDFLLRLVESEVLARYEYKVDNAGNREEVIDPTGRNAYRTSI